MNLKTTAVITDNTQQHQKQIATTNSNSYNSKLQQQQQTTTTTANYNNNSQQQTTANNSQQQTTTTTANSKQQPTATTDASSKTSSALRIIHLNCPDKLSETICGCERWARNAFYVSSLVLNARHKMNITRVRVTVILGSLLIDLCNLSSFNLYKSAIRIVIHFTYTPKRKKNKPKTN